LESLFHAQNVGGFPAEMLATVDRDELAGDAGAVEEEPQCGGDVGGFAPRPRTVAARWRAKCGLGLPEARRVGPGPMALTRMFGARPCAAVWVRAQRPILAMV
jgi:hypothetical protein